MLKMISLPRQAPDKHRESTQSDMRFWTVWRDRRRRRDDDGRWWRRGRAARADADALAWVRRAADGAGKKTALFEPFIYKNQHFTKTGSGQS
eukprot:COSAG06_NODE_1351_length_9765_cov_3.151976_4_plen_92_part_00